MDNFIKFWNNVNYDNAAYITHNFPELSTFLLQGLLQSTFIDDEVSTGLTYLDSVVCSQITFDQYNDDKTLSLCVNREEIWSLAFTYWDEDGEEQKAKHILNKEQLDIIPAGLLNILMTTLRTETTMTIKKNALSNIMK